VETTAFVPKSLLASAESTEVFSCLGGDIGTKLKGDATSVLTTNFHIKEDCKDGKGGKGP
jgi:hypothetical protein